MRVKIAKDVLSVLIVEDNKGDQLIITESLRNSCEENFVTQTCTTLAEAVNIISKSNIDVVILDLGLPDSSGLDTLNKIIQADNSLPVIVLTIYGSDEAGVLAIENGAQEFLIKDDLHFLNLYKSIRYAIHRKKLELQLKDSLNLFENTFEQAAVGLAHLSCDTNFIKVNRKFCEILGYTKEELTGLSLSTVTYPPDLEEDLHQLEQLIAGKLNSYSLEKRFVRKDGAVIWAKLIRTAILNDQNEIQYFFSTIEDINERKKLEIELNNQKGLLDTIINLLPVGVWLTDEKGTIIRSNKRAEEIWGGSHYVDINNLRHYKGWWADSGKEIQNDEWAVYRAVHNREVSLGEIINIECFDGRRKTIINSVVPLIINDKVVSVIAVNEDITSIIQTEEKLKGLVQEKELLIKESHHRIKNNLQLMTSLLMLSLSNFNDPAVKNALTDSLNRITSISALHEYLYRSSSYNEVNVQSYLYKILDYIKASLSVDNQNVKLIKDIDNFDIDSGLAISLGLIINELVTNALKYAFKKDGKGIIELELKKDESSIHLKVKDNGIGLPENFDLGNITTLGFQIVTSLVDQHNGKVNYFVKDGTEFEITIPFE